MTGTAIMTRVLSAACSSSRCLCCTASSSTWAWLPSVESRCAHTNDLGLTIRKRLHVTNRRPSDALPSSPVCLFCRHPPQFWDRIKLYMMPPKHQPDFSYLRHVPLRKVHLFTLVQIICLAVLWILKSTFLAIIFPVMVCEKTRLQHRFYQIICYNLAGKHFVRASRML